MSAHVIMLEEDRVRKAIDKLEFAADSVSIPKSDWKMIDFAELPSGLLKVVIQAGARFFDIQIDRFSTLKVLNSYVTQAISAAEYGANKMPPKIKSKSQQAQRAHLTLLS